MKSVRLMLHNRVQSHVFSKVLSGMSCICPLVCLHNFPYLYYLRSIMSFDLRHCKLRFPRRFTIPYRTLSIFPHNFSTCSCSFQNPLKQISMEEKIKERKSENVGWVIGGMHDCED